MLAVAIFLLELANIYWYLTPLSTNTISCYCKLLWFKSLQILLTLLLIEWITYLFKSFTASAFWSSSQVYSMYTWRPTTLDNSSRVSSKLVCELPLLSILSTSTAIMPIFGKLSSHFLHIPYTAVYTTLNRYWYSVLSCIWRFRGLYSYMGENHHVSFLFGHHSLSSLFPLSWRRSFGSRTGAELLELIRRQSMQATMKDFTQRHLGRRSRKSIGNELGCRHNVRRCRIRLTLSIRSALLIVFPRGLLLIHFSCSTVYCLRQLPLSHCPLRIEKSLFLSPFDPLSVCLYENLIHRRSPLRLFIASWVRPTI